MSQTDRADAHLILVLAVSYKGAVGFGDVFDGEVTRVRAGTLADARITLSIVAKDKDRLQFVTAHQAPARIEIGFTMLRRDEPYALAPISGFVDSGRTSWEIAFIRDPGVEPPN